MFESGLVSFDVWKKKNTDGKERLMGNDKQILLYHFPEKMNDFLRPETAEKIVKIWVNLAALYEKKKSVIGNHILAPQSF